GLIHSRLLMVSFIAARMFFTISCARTLACGGKYFPTYFLPNASPLRMSVEFSQRFQRAFSPLPPPTHCSYKSKVSLPQDGERAVAGRCRMQELRFEVGLPVRQRDVAELAVNLLQELRLVHVEIDVRDPGRIEVSIPIDARRQLLQIGKAHFVICGLGIAQS